MSFSRDILLNKFSLLNDTEQSIVAISQWVLFHWRYAAVTAKTWSEYVITGMIFKPLHNTIIDFTKI